MEKPHFCGKGTGQSQAVRHSAGLAAWCWAGLYCSAPLCYLVGAGGTQQEGLKDRIPSDEGKLVKAAPVFFSRKCGMLVTQFEIF